MASDIPQRGEHDSKRRPTGVDQDRALASTPLAAWLVAIALLVLVLVVIQVV